MDEENSIAIGFSQRVPARVLASLRGGTLTVILHPGNGLADGGSKVEIPIEAVPLDLRMPNCEFDMLFDRASWSYIEVVRKGDPNPIKADDRIVGVEFTNDDINVALIDGRVITVPLYWYPRLQDADEAQRQNWQISGGGYGLHWPDIDEDLSTAGLLRGVPAPRRQGQK